MALSEALHNIGENYRFHWSVSGSRARRLSYITLYYALFIVLRWGDRHRRALQILRRLGLSGADVDVRTAEGLRLRMDMHAAFDPLFSILHDRDYERLPGFAPAAGQTVIDVGANVGVFTTHAAALVGSTGRVVAVEPNPKTFQVLKGNVERNGLSNARLVAVAADDHEGTARLFIHDFPINSSLKRASGDSVDVPLWTLDRIAREQKLERLDLIKIDTEGNVPGVLRGAAGLIEKHRPRIVFERDDAPESEGLWDLLRSFGYEWKDIRCFTYAWPRAS